MSPLNMNIELVAKKMSHDIKSRNFVMNCVNLGAYSNWKYRRKDIMLLSKINFTIYRVHRIFAMIIDKNECFFIRRDLKQKFDCHVKRDLKQKFDCHIKRVLSQNQRYIYRLSFIWMRNGLYSHVYSHRINETFFT